jgi:D-alanine--poly(phosphoribitol) ligase subunit 1
MNTKKNNNLIFLKNIKNFSKKNPNDICIVEENKKITYEEFYLLCVNFANTVLKLKKKNIIVTIIESKTIIDYVAIMGTLLAGGTYVPINIKTPVSKINQIILDTKANCLVDSVKLIKKYDKKKIKLIRKLSDLSNEITIRPKSINDIAYIIFTSGSTGNPKGVMISRSNLNHYVQWLKNTFINKRKINCSQIPSIGFDLSVADIYLALSTGNTLVLPSNNMDKIFPGVYLKKYKINHLTCTPTLINLLIKSKHLNNKFLSSLESIFFCGEPLQKSQLKGIFKINSKIKIINAYGPTETTVSVTSILINSKNYLSLLNKYISFGKPIKNIKLKLLSDKLSVSKKGEILIAGPQVALGYFKNKEETNKKFKIIDGIKYYFTGDIGFRYKNNYYFEKRIDNQIKHRGYRIELEEINNILRKFGFGNVFTTINKNKLISFLETKKIDEKKIKIKISKYLENYKVPEKFVCIENFPVNKNGKIDNNKLKKIR